MFSYAFPMPKNEVSAVFGVETKATIDISRHMINIKYYDKYMINIIIIVID